MEVHLRPFGARTAASVLLPLAVAFLAMVGAYSGLPVVVCFDIAWTSAAASALIALLHARSRARIANRKRLTLWSLAAGSWLVGQIGWDVFGVIGFPTSPHVADFGWYGFALLIMASMLRMPRVTRPIQVVILFEALPLIAAAIALTVALAWTQADASALPLAPKLAAVAYPALYISAAVLTLQAMAAGVLRGVRAMSLRLVLAGLGAQALAFSLWSSQLLRGTYVTGHSLLDPLWVVGLGAIAIGGLLAARRPEPIAEFDEPTHLGVVLPAAMFLVLLFALVTARVAGAPTGETITLEVGLMFCGAALIARSTLLGGHMKVLLHRERAALSRLAERESELATLNQQLVEDSRRDPLTGIGNRRALADDLPMLEALSHDPEETFAFALCDVDHFKSYNDRLGHLAGDQALRMIAAIARGALRESDAAYRFGGEELLLVLRNVDQVVATKAAERVRRAVERAALPHLDGEGGVLTVSVGVACGTGDPGQLLASADAALYEAKHAGRNQVIASSEGTRSPIPRSHRKQATDEPVPRHLRSMLAVSRAAAAGQGPMPVLDALAETIRNELSFQVVVVNLREDEAEEMRVVLVLGDHEARSALLGTTNTMGEWEGLLAAGENVHGAAWLAAGSYEWESEGAVWTPPEVASLFPDAWHPEDMLLLPLRSSSSELLGVVSVDQPLLGRRPSEAEIGVLMAVVDHAGLALDQKQRGGELEPDQSDELRLAAVMLLAETLDLRDPSTARHSSTVGQLARETALELGFSDDRVSRIHAAGVLHDLGKLGISDAILHKPGPLDDAEWREMRRHPEVGARILEHAGMRDIAAWVRAHHERVDGCGYPGRLHGHEISIEARILAVADAYEAMITDRPYRSGMPSEAACAELVSCGDSQFDPTIVDAFLRALRRRAEHDGAPALRELAAPASLPAVAAGGRRAAV